MSDTQLEIVENPTIMEATSAVTVLEQSATALSVIWSVVNGQVAGVNAGKYASLNEAVAVIGTILKTQLFVDSTVLMTGPCTVPSNITIGSSFTGLIDNQGYALTINGDFYGGLSQHFAGSGAVLFGPKTTIARPEWWGNNASPGTTNMTAATQAAADSLEYGGKLVIGSDHYIESVTISNPIMITSDGASYNRSRFINLANTALTMFYITSGHGVTFRDIALWGPGKTGTSKAIVAGDGTNNIDMFALENCEIFGFSVGADIKTQNWRVDKNTLISTCGTGLLLTGLPSAASRRNGYIGNSWIHSCDVGVSVPNVWFSVGIYNNDFNSCGDGIVGALARSSILGNVFHNCTGNEISVNSTSSSTNLGVHITDNIIHGSGTANSGTGIKLTGDYGNVSDNTVSSKGGHGISIVGSLNRVRGNTSKDCDYFDTTTYDGINIAGNSNRVEGNICRTTTGGASKQRYGICVASGTGNIIKNNTTESNKSGQISADAATNTVAQNTGFKTENQGGASISSGTSVVVSHGLAITPGTGSISITPTTSLAGASFWVSNITSTQFTINVSVSGSYSFWWKI